MSYIKPDDHILVIIGPSGSGKSSLVHALMQDGLIDLTATYTTRPRRSDEEDALDHVFCNDKEFDSHDKQELFIETVTLFNQPYRYGMPKIKKPEGRIVPTIMLRAMVMPLLKKHYTNTTIYHIESPKNEVKRRLLKRKDKSASDRMQFYDIEVQFGRNKADRIFVNDGDLAEVYSDLMNAMKQDFDLS